MIADDTILEHLRWIQYERSGESHCIANSKCNDILQYVFPDFADKGFFFEKDGIRIEKWGGSYRHSYCGIKMEFCDNYNRRTQWRTIEFKRTAKEFKAKVLEKFELLKAQKVEADKKADIRQAEDKKRLDEVDELQKMVNGKFGSAKWYSDVAKTFGGSYQLTLRKNFDTKQELIDYINSF